MKILVFFLCGAIGGLARGIVGAYKSSLYVGNGKKIDWKKMTFNIVGSLVVGSVVGAIVDTNPVLALTSGYAGIDIIESVIKLSKK